MLGQYAKTNKFTLKRRKVHTIENDRLEIRYPDGTKFGILEWKGMKGFLGKRFDSLESKIDQTARKVQKEAKVAQLDELDTFQIRTECSCHELRQKIIALQKKVESIEKIADKLVLIPEEEVLFSGDLVLKEDTPGQIYKGIYKAYESLDIKMREKRASELYASMWPY